LVTVPPLWEQASQFSLDVQQELEVQMEEPLLHNLLSGLSELSEAEQTSFARFLVERSIPVISGKSESFIEIVNDLEQALLNSRHSSPSSANIEELIIGFQDTELEDLENLFRSTFEIATFLETNDVASIMNACRSIFDFVEDRVKDLVIGSGRHSVDAAAGLKVYNQIWASPIYLGEHAMLNQALVDIKKSTMRPGYGKSASISLYYLRNPL